MITYANGTSAQYGYTARGDLTCHDWNLTGAAPSACNVAGAEIAYDFTFNGVGQLVTKALNDPLLKWSPPGNTSDAYAANGLNQYTAITPDGGAAAAIAHDASANITTDHRGRTYVYDAENVLQEAKNPDGSMLANFYHYADGQLRLVLPTNMRPYYDGDQAIIEMDDAWPLGGGDETTLRRYVRLPGSVDEALLMIDYTMDAGCTNASYANCEVWAHQNRLGSVVATTNSAGAVIEKYQYSPYGESGPEGDAGFPFRFTGQRLEPTTGLYYYKARWYDPETGRFLQTDPIGYEDQMNLYAYVGNDPVNATDPTGKCPWCIIGAAVGAIAGAVVEKVTNPNATKESIALAALVGAASGALGPAGGAAARVALVGRAGAKAAAVAVKSGTATRAVKALTVTTDVAADVIGQPVLGAAVAAASGDNPGQAAIASETAAGVGAVERVSSAQSNKPRGTTRVGLARTAVSVARQVASTIVKGQAGEAAAEQIVEDDD